MIFGKAETPNRQNILYFEKNRVELAESKRREKDERK